MKPTCAHCGNELVRKRYASGMEGHKAFNARRFCNNTCRGAHTRLQSAAKLAELSGTRSCERCGNPITLTEARHIPAYATRRFCSKDCALSNARAQRTYHHNPKPNPAAKRRARKPRAKSKPSPSKRNTGQFNLRNSTPGITEMRMERHETIRMRLIHPPCPKHPTYGVGFYGCAACNASRKRREDPERERRFIAAETRWW